eukprot:5029869-Alexandrium_andersonii.AAC.1
MQEALEWLDDQVHADREIEAKFYDLQGMVWPIILMTLQRESNLNLNLGAAENEARGNNSELCVLEDQKAVALPPDIPGLYFKGWTRTERDANTGLYKAPRRNADPA